MMRWQPFCGVASYLIGLFTRIADEKETRLPFVGLFDRQPDLVARRFWDRHSDGVARPTAIIIRLE